MLIFKFDQNDKKNRNFFRKFKKCRNFVKLFIDNICNICSN